MTKTSRNVATDTSRGARVTVRREGLGPDLKRAGLQRRGGTNVPTVKLTHDWYGPGLEFGDYLVLAADINARKKATATVNSTNFLGLATSRITGHDVPTDTGRRHLQEERRAHHRTTGQAEPIGFHTSIGWAKSL